MQTLPAKPFAALLRVVEKTAAPYEPLARSQQSEAFEQVSRFAQEIATQFSLPGLVDVAVRRTRELTDSDGASLVLVDPQNGELYFDTVDGSAERSLTRLRLERGRGIVGKVALEAHPRLVADTRQCEDFDPSADFQTGFRTGTIVAAPLVLAGDVLGVLMAVRAVGKPAFTEAEFDQLVRLAPHVAIAVHNAQITAALRSSQEQVLAANQSLEAKVQQRTEELSRGKREWERSFDAISEPIVLLDGFTVRRANRAWARKVGVPITKVVGEKCHKLFAGRDTPCPNCPLLEERASAPATAEIKVADSTFRFSSHWMGEGPDSTVVVHYQDVTRAQALEERVRASERLAVVGQLASGAAHEINNPLAFVTSNLRSLESLIKEVKSGAALDPDDLEDGMAMINESLDGARRIADIVKALRELSKLEVTRTEVSDVNGSITRAVRNELAGFDRLHLELQNEAIAEIAPLQLDQVLGHVLKNARQAVSGAQKIFISTEQDDRHVTIRVRDEGQGIDAAHLPRVFEPFFTTRGVGKGIGLGLTAAWGLAKRAGGELTCESAGPGKGTTLTVRLNRRAG